MSAHSLLKVCTRSMHSIAEKLIFFRQFMRHPKMIGSVIPTSAVVIDALLSRVDWKRASLFVEYGPGIGTFTRPILERLRPDGRLVAIDTNPDFTAYLRRTIDDPRLEAVNGSAVDVEDILGTRHGGERPAHILSGLPLSTLPQGVAELIMESAARALQPGGSMLIYQYSSRFVRALDPFFAEVKMDRIWRNIPPCVIAEAWVNAVSKSAGQVEAAGDLVIKDADKKVA
ncbi:class I SAM-dependent methyltransferase [Sphingobium fluviale]|uniref:Methyltransferase n=1 Tax=Sphingobium fluviale TaxID=2506423 RepID=A0A4V1N365_9SPHN|nr:methyltransferase [Sphingobium fluviale]RXR25592.1 methyltransferase [Sphingobium fluviale]